MDNIDGRSRSMHVAVGVMIGASGYGGNDCGVNDAVGGRPQPPVETSKVVIAGKGECANDPMEVTC